MYLINVTAHKYLKVVFESHYSYGHFRSSHPEVFCEKGVLENFAKFTVKHLRHSLFLNKVVGLRIHFSKDTHHRHILLTRIDHYNSKLSKTIYFEKKHSLTFFNVVENAQEN